MRPGHIDYFLLVATVMLLIVGLLAVYTSSFAVGYSEYGDANFFVKRQAVFALIGLGALVGFMCLDYNHLRRLSVPMLIVALVGLLLVLTPIGVAQNGARRWLQFGPMTVQPSEFAKLAIIV
ncbi:MAG: FtsW/RodA/SpoVE family cell cycle protein, partial [Chloroflexota bacterium]|nr:FtsW/RodA/SpoVE family cell cycle protein [Chloroflexota bacterium]